MIHIFNSTSRRQTSTAQDLLNDLADESVWWGTIWRIDRDETTNNVIKFWVTYHIYFSLSSDATPKLKITHEASGAQDVSKTAFAVMPTYSIIATDKGIIVTNGTVQTSSGLWFAIGNTTAPDNDLSLGVIFDFDNNIVEYVFTDNMTTSSYNSYTLGSGIGKSRENTVLAPAYSVTGDEKFDDLMLVVLSKPTDTGRVVLNGKYYYINEAVALPYTP